LSGGVESRSPTVPAATDSTSALQSILPHVLDTLRREPAVAITLCYLLVAMAGIFYNYWFYRGFDIPVLTLSQISDFLVAGLQQPMALLLVVSTFPLCWLMDLYNLRSRRRHVEALARLRASVSLSGYQRLRRRFLEWRVGEMWYTQLSYVAVVAVYGWAFVGIYAKYRAEAVKRGEGAEVRIWLNGENGGLASGQSATWSYLGAVANYVFVYDRAEQRALVLPVNAIARLQPMPAPKRQSRVFVAPIP
jgi:hypothetical protein